MKILNLTLLFTALTALFYFVVQYVENKAYEEGLKDGIKESFKLGFKACKVKGVSDAIKAVNEVDHDDTEVKNEH